MAGNLQSKRPVPAVDGSGLRIGLVCGRFNDVITDRLLTGATTSLGSLGVASDDIVIRWVPGAFEIPVAGRAMLFSGQVDAVIGLGAVIRGETTHYESVAGECARGIQTVQLEVGKPFIFGVLTTENDEQALARSELTPSGHNVGAECAQTAVEMLRLLAEFPPR